MERWVSLTYTLVYKTNPSLFNLLSDVFLSSSEIAPEGVRWVHTLHGKNTFVFFLFIFQFNFVFFLSYFVQYFPCCISLCLCMCVCFHVCTWTNVLIFTIYIQYVCGVFWDNCLRTKKKIFPHCFYHPFSVLFWIVHARCSTASHSTDAFPHSF